MQWEFAMDAGSENLRFATKERPNQFHESAYVMMRTARGAPVAWGDRALAYLGRERAGMVLARPVRGGVPMDAKLLGLWTEKLIKGAPTRPLKRSGILLGVSPACLIEYSRRAQRNMIDAGADAVGLVRLDIACALGAGLDVLAAQACLIIDAGAETTTGSLISGGRVVRCETLPFGMSRIDDYLQRSLGEQLGCAFGPITLREIKHELAAAEGVSGRVETQKLGFNYAAMLPREHTVRAVDVISATNGVVREISDMCARLVCFAPEELAADMTRGGVTLAGGGGNLFGLDERISKATGLNVKIAEDREYCAILGMHKMLQEPQKYAHLITDVLEGT